ncbi:hypothetical protein [Pseudomonas sp. 6D_7.1_Bac1]|uniref:hypothetical protein n=1 Tax=Pseudomonas sp. 6D_7.1_Bac1 TaxID=2971615 RepID=UPI0021C6D1CE|nr:hypothetical protein [Pseudomonas sp. 6D_7.1_Bac1]MCU1751487.1 hypothetical protein [Pseudomonas sp. 6D_7.1_Bac1]
MSEHIQQKMSAAERIAFIEESSKLMLGTMPRARSASILANAELPIDKDELNAAIMGTGIVGFDPSMTKRSKRIVKNTYMYADLKALLAFPGENQKEQRYNSFSTSMRAMGWTFFSSPFSRYTSSSKTLTMDNVALDLIHTVVAGAVGGVAGKALLGKAADAALKALKTEPEALKLFEDNAKKASGGNFAMTTCKQDDDGDITMAAAAIQYSCAAHPTKVLFWEWATSEVSIWKGASVMTMDEEDYLLIEDLVVKTLSEMRQKALTIEFGPAAA